MSTLCVCGHAEGYHDAKSLLDSSDGLCSIWAELEHALSGIPYDTALNAADPHGVKMSAPP